MRSAIVFFLFCLPGLPGLCFVVTKKQFEGYFMANGKEVPFVVKLWINGDSLSGNYYYSGIGKDISLNGRLKGNNITITETYDSVVTGVFTGFYYRGADSIAGTWTGKKGRKKLHFHLERREWVDYRIIYRNKGRTEGDWGWNWIEMLGNPDTVAQRKFNALDENTAVAPGAIWGPGFDRDSTQYSFAKLTTVDLAAPGFISFEVFHSDYLGGMGANNDIEHYLFDFESQGFLTLNELLREDTSSEEILGKWIETEIKRRGDWDNWQADYVSNSDGFPGNDFYFANDGVYFFFPRPGAVTNILGIEDVRIPYDKMVLILAKNTEEYKWVVEKLGRGRQY
ncbi:MAG TPA: hypothetical protein VI112_04080 [Bacteroidia bacterium]|jgi:hypothetical protein